MQTVSQQQELTLIGLVSRELIRDKLNTQRQENPDGHTLLRFDSLRQNILESCVNAVAVDKANRNDLDIRIPASLVRASAIVDTSVLFAGSAAQARNTPSTKPLVLFANAQDKTVEDTLREIAAIDEEQLKANAGYWIRVLPELFTQFTPNSPFALQLEAMFSAFLTTMKPNLVLGARYLLETTRRLLTGSAINSAASEALLYLRLPRFISAMPIRSKFDSEPNWTKAFSTIQQTIPPEFFTENRRPLTLSLETLQENLTEIKAHLSATTNALYTALANDDGTHTWDELLQCDWADDEMNAFFTGKAPKSSPKTLGQETLKFCQEECNYKLSEYFDNDRTLGQFLEYFAENDRIKKDEENFVPQACRVLQLIDPQLSQNPKLLAKWEKFIYPTEVVCEDFLDGLLRAGIMLARQSSAAMPANPVFLVTCNVKTDEFFNFVNWDLIQYFATTYIGLEEQCSDFIAFRFKYLHFKTTGNLNPLFHPTEAREHIAEEYRRKISHSVAKKARALNFTLSIVDRTALTTPNNNTAKPQSLKLTWQLPNDSVAFGLSQDLHELLPANAQAKSQVENLFRVTAGQNFKQSNSKGLLAAISLANVKSFGFTSGTFVAKNSTKLELDIRTRFEALLKEVTPSSDTLSAAWEKFCETYRTTITDVLAVGYGSKRVLALEETFKGLLETTVTATANNVDLRKQLLSLLLSLGVFSFADQKYSHAVVMPWNPVRLGALHRYFVTRAGLLKAMLQHPKDAPLDFDAFCTQLRLATERFEPHVVVVPDEPVPANIRPFQTVLSPIEHAFGFTLYSQVTGDNCQNDTPRPGAEADLLDIAENFLKLAPQATDCLKVWLPDVTDKAFPLTAIKKLGDALPESERLSFSVGGVENANAEQVAKKLFSGLLEATAKNAEIQETSFTTAEQPSRLRMQVITPDNIKRQMEEPTRPWDIAFLDHYFTRSAEIAWTFLPRLDAASNPYSLRAALQDDARRVMPTNEQHVSNTLLCPANVSELGHVWLNAVYLTLKGQSDKSVNQGTFAYPAIRIDTNTKSVADEIERVHKLAHWVITCNNLLDRRQLLQSKIDIVRYRRNITTGRTCIVSCQMPRDLISSKLVSHLGDIYNDSVDENIAKCILDTAYGISGYIAMRSAKTDTAASEITGLALSHWINMAKASYLCEKKHEKLLLATSILVDDYSGLLIYNKMLADLLTLVLAEHEGQLQLHILISEAKFRTAAKAARSYSARQAAATATKLLEALTTNNAAPLRPFWHAFLADLVMAVRPVDIVDETIKTDTNKLVQYAQQIRRGDFNLSINAASHIFVSAEEGTVERVDCDETPECPVEQLVLCRNEIKTLLIAQLKGKNFAETLERCFITASQDDGPMDFHDVQATPARPWIDGLTLAFLEGSQGNANVSGTQNATGDNPDSNLTESNGSNDVANTPEDPDEPDDPAPQDAPFCAHSEKTDSSSASVSLPSSVLPSQFVTLPPEPVISPAPNDASRVDSTEESVANPERISDIAEFRPTFKDPMPPNSKASGYDPEASAENAQATSRQIEHVGHADRAESVATLETPKSVSAFVMNDSIASAVESLATVAPDSSDSTEPIETPEIADIAKATPVTPSSSTISSTQVFSPAFDQLVRARGKDFCYSDERIARAHNEILRLRNFLTAKGIQTTILAHKVTPNGCLVKFKGTERLTTKEFERYSEPLLTTESINVLFTVAAPGEFRVLFNDGTDTRESVPMWSAWSHQKVERHGELNLSFVIGLKESDGELLELNPIKADPHTLIAGESGSGKTALVQELLLDMAATNPSNLLKILLIDPKKGVDYRPLFELPHIIQPIVTETAAIASTIEALIDEMERRYVLFEKEGVNKLTNYNAKVAPEKRLPALFVVHDEISSCMQDPDYKNKVPSLITKLVTKSRAAGIFLILIAQRPDHRVLDPQIRDNLGNRLILKLPAGTGTSEFALGERGAENLLGKGHMAARMNGKVEFAQVPFLSDQNEVLEEVASAIRKADADWQVPSAGVPQLEASLRLGEH